MPNSWEPECLVPMTFWTNYAVVLLSRFGHSQSQIVISTRVDPSKATTCPKSWQKRDTERTVPICSSDPGSLSWQLVVHTNVRPLLSVQTAFLWVKLEGGIKGYVQEPICSFGHFFDSISTRVKWWVLGVSKYWISRAWLVVEPTHPINMKVATGISWYHHSTYHDIVIWNKLET